MKCAADGLEPMSKPMKLTSRIRARFGRGTAAPAPAASESTAALAEPAGPETAKIDAAKIEPVKPEATKADAPNLVAGKPGLKIPAQPALVSRLVEKRADLSRRATEKLARAVKLSEPWRKPTLAAAAVAAVAGLSYAGGRIEGRQTRLTEVSAARLAEAADGIRESREEFGRLGLEVKSIRTSLDGLKGERIKTDPIVRMSQINDRVERLSGDTASKITRMSEQLERIEKTQRDPGRLQGLFERFDRLEKQVGGSAATTSASAPVLSAAPTPPPKPLAMISSGDVTQTGSLADGAKNTEKAALDPRKVQLEGYILRDVEDGWALVETRYGRVVEVSSGQTIPGLGRVEAIEKRGRQWVVVTPKGFIGERFN